MTHNAVFKSGYANISINSLNFDGDTGQSVTLEELAKRREETEHQRFYQESTPISNSIREENWNILANKFKEVLHEKYNEDFVAPTNHILEGAIKLLQSINDFLGYEMPVPRFIVPDGEGGIRVEWRNHNKHLRLSLSDERVYLYFEEAADYGVIEDFDAVELIERLKWLNQ